MNNAGSELTLTLQAPCLPRYLPVVVPFVENAAGAFDMGRPEALSLGLATEEIFVYLAGEICPEKPVEIECRSGLYYASVEFRFSGRELNLGGLNIAAGADIDAEGDLKEMGLLLASRSVDRLNITVGEDRRITLSLAKDKSYPPAGESGLRVPDHQGAMTARAPDPEEMKEFALRLAADRTDHCRPPYFNYPGKVVDMVGGGEYGAIVAIDARGDVAGGLLYCFRAERIVQMLGPFSFVSTGEATLERSLLDACLSRLARTRAISLISLTGLPASLAADFESLGRLTYYREGGEAVKREAYGRLLNEDPGCAIWTAPELSDYLAGEYDRLALAREMKIIRDLGETRLGASIFATELTRDRGLAHLRPLWPGADLETNVERHVRHLHEEGFLNLLFFLDLGIPWHGALVPILLSRRFRIAGIIPFGGRADEIIFQYHAA